MSVRRRVDKDPATGEVLRERWMVDFVHQQPDGKRIRIREFPPCDTKLDAMKWEQQVRKSLADGTFRRGGTDAPVVPTLGKFSERFLEWSETHNKPSTVAAKQAILTHHLVPAFGSLRLDALTLGEVESFKAAQLRAGVGRKTVKNQLAVLGKLLNLAAEWGVVQTVPRVKTLRVEQKEIEFLDVGEADRLIEAAEPQWRPFIVTGLRTGLRVGELLALRWEDVDLKAARLNVRRTLWNGQEGSPKGGKARQVPLGDQVLAVLKENRSLKSYVFCRADGARLTHSAVKDVVPRACRRAGLAKRLTTHGLRHSFASHLVMAGVTLVAVKELLGHADIQTTMRYAHLAPGVTRDAVRMLDPGSRAWHPCGTGSSRN